MRFFHISDLHIGKQLNGYNLRESQDKVLSQIAFYAEKERPDAILICGDIYDKSVPSGEAHTVFDAFLNRLAKLRPSVPVMIIAGNHDSPERLRYASALLEKHKIYISVLPPGSEAEHLKKVTLKDQWGNVNFYLLPFMKPGYVRSILPKEAEEGYTSAFAGVVKREEVDKRERNVILAHQFFVKGNEQPKTCESEQPVLTVGGIDQVDVKALLDFDYAALGHLHGAQRVGDEAVRYSGSPLKYSVSEEHHQKSVTVVTLLEKGKAPAVEFLPLTSSLEVRKERGSLQDILDRATEDNRHDYVSITLTDEEEMPDFRILLEERYDHILDIKIDNQRTRKRLSEDFESVECEHLSPVQAFSRFYEAVRHTAMTGEQEQFIKQIMADLEIAGEEEV